MTTTEVRRGWCGPCHTRGGLLVDFEGGQAVKVRGDPQHPVNRGAMCARGRLILDHLYHPDRLNYPLKRAGERGSGHWQRITWEQALDEMGERLGELRERYGAETLAYSHGTHPTYDWPL